MNRSALLAALVAFGIVTTAFAQTPAIPEPLLPGGIVVPLYPAGSPHLKADRVGEAEKITRSGGRVQNIVNIHNPSIEVHAVGGARNTGTVVIVAPGGGHRNLVAGSEGTDEVAWLYGYGVSTVILRYRLARADGYDLEKDAMLDALEAVRLVRSRAAEWKFDPAKIGIMGFSAGAEVAAWTGVYFEKSDNENKTAGGPLANVSARPDFVALIYPGPTPFARGANPAIPLNAPPSFITCAGPGDKVHAVWADEYFAAMLKAGIPNLEMHIYANGGHGGGLTDRGGTPFGTWPMRFIDWVRDLGFLGKTGVETKAAQDVAAFVKKGK